MMHLKMIISATLLTTLAHGGSRSDRGLLQARIAKLRSGRRLASTAIADEAELRRSHRRRLPGYVNAAARAEAERQEKRREATNVQRVRQVRQQLPNAMQKIQQHFEGSQAYNGTDFFNQDKGFGDRIVANLKAQARAGRGAFRKNAPLDPKVEWLVRHMPTKEEPNKKVGWLFKDHRFEDDTHKAVTCHVLVERRPGQTDTYKISEKASSTTANGSFYWIKDHSFVYECIGKNFHKEVFNTTQVAANLALEFCSKYRTSINSGNVRPFRKDNGSTDTPSVNYPN